MKLCIVTSHPIQYQAPWFRELAKRCELKVFFAHQPDAAQQGEGFGKAFEWDVDLLAGYDSEFLRNVSRSPGSGHFGGCDTPEIGAKLRAGGFDAVILNGWYLKSYLQALWACKRAGIPVLVRGDSQLGTPRSRVKQWLKEPVYRWLLGRPDGFLTVGQRNREYLRHYGVPEARIFPAPHFVDNEWFAARAAVADRGAIRERWGVPTDGMAVLFAGKFQEKKRPLDLVRAVAALPAAERPHLVFVGSGALEESLRGEAARAGVAAVFPGFLNQSELPGAYAAADVLALPSGSETWGLVVNEAMACGTPAVVSDACGCAPDLIIPGETGFVHPPGDVAALADRLREVWKRKRAGHDWTPVLARKMNDYSVDACASGTMAAVRAVMK